jgi:hypothetical protein
MAIIPKNILSELVNGDGTRIGGNNVKLSRDNSKSASNSTMDPMYDLEGDQIKNSVVQSTRQQGYRGYYSLVPMPAVRTPTASVYTYMNNIDYMSDEPLHPQSDFTDIGEKRNWIKKVNNEPEEIEWWEDTNTLIIDISDKLNSEITMEDLYDFEEFMGYPYWQSKEDFENTFVSWWEDKEKYYTNRMEESSKKKMKSMVEDIVDKKFPKEVVDKIKKYGDIRKNGVPDIEIISDENPLLVRKVKNLIDIVEKNQATGEQKGVILNFLINNIGTVDIPAEYKQEMLKKLR